MVYGIVRDHKLRNQNRNQLDNTTDTSSAPSAPSYRYKKSNEKTDITSKKSLTVETHSRTIFDLDDKLFDIIINKSTSNPYSKDMLFLIFLLIMM